MMMLVSQITPPLLLPSSLTETSLLYRSLRSGLAELDGLARASSVMELELSTFLEVYYARVLPLAARLERLRYRRKHGIFPQKGAIDPKPARQANPLELWKKALFRRLVKRCHPDNRISSPISITQVYEAKTISELWLLEMRCAAEDDVDLNAYLETQRDDMVELLRKGHQHNQQFQESDMWLLKERVYDAALQGEDLIDQIQQRIENQIAAMQQLFVKPRDFQAVA